MQKFRIDVDYLPVATINGDNLIADDYNCIEVLVPDTCETCGFNLIMRKERATACSSFEKCCKHYGSYVSVYENRVQVRAEAAKPSTYKEHAFSNCTKCDFEYPYGGKAICKQCELWKTITG